MNIRLEIVRHREHRRVPGYLGREERDFQSLVLVREWRILGIPLRRRKVLDREEIPQATLIALGATGYDAGGWLSKWADLITAQRRLKTAAPQARDKALAAVAAAERTLLERYTVSV